MNTSERPRRGFFLLLQDPSVAEAIATTAPDFVVVDMEAGVFDRERALRIVQAVAHRLPEVYVRVSSHAVHDIEHAMDIGATGVVVPKVESAAQARAVAAATRYPPRGTRGVNPVRASGYFTELPGYFADAAARARCLVQIESRQAAQQVEEICAVDGVDGVFLGMGDLAMEVGQPGDTSGETLRAIRLRCVAAARRCGKFAGAFAYSVDDAATYADEGFTFVAVSNDVKLLLHGAVAVLGAVDDRWQRSSALP